MKIGICIQLILMLGVFLFGESKVPTVAKGSAIKTRRVQVIDLINLNDLKGHDPKAMSVMNNGCFDVDEEGNYYFLEMLNHRVVKFNSKGEFVCQIGSIGQGEKDLYSPIAICIDGNSILVSNREGKAVKRFSLNGEFISSFDIPDVFLVDTIRAHDGKIYCDARYKTDDWYKRNAISVFDAGGKFLKGIGKSLKTTEMFTYQFFNTVYFQVQGNHIIGAFKSSPVIYKYDLDGRTVFYIDLGKLNIPEVDEKLKQVNESAYDTPGQRKSTDSNTIMGVFYSTGCVVDPDGHLYYDFITSSESHIILHFDSSGSLLEKLILEKEDHPVILRGIYIRKSVRYGIGSFKNFKEGLMLFIF